MIPLIAGGAAVVWLLNKDYVTPEPIKESFEQRRIHIETGEYTSHCWKVSVGVLATYIVITIK